METAGTVIPCVNETNNKDNVIQTFSYLNDIDNKEVGNEDIYTSLPTSLSSYTIAERNQ